MYAAQEAVLKMMKKGLRYRKLSVHEITEGGYATLFKYLCVSEEEPPTVQTAVSCQYEGERRRKTIT